MSELEEKLNKEIGDLLDKLGRDYKFILYKELVRSNKVASGELVKSLSWRVKDNALEFVAAPYITYVDGGRKPGSYAPINEIKKWCRLKSIPESAAYAINKNIFKRGIRPTGVLSKSMSIFEKRNLGTINGLLSNLLERLIEEELKNDKK